MQYQDPSGTWENSDEYLYLQNQIADMITQRENLMRADHRGMSMASKAKMSEKLALFDFKINELKRKITPVFTKQNSQMFNQPKTMKSFSTNGVSFPNGGQIPKTMSASERKWFDHAIKNNGKITPSTPQFNF